MAVSPDGWINSIRLAVKNWLLNDPAGSGTASNGNRLTDNAVTFETVSTMPGVLRYVTVTAAANAGNVGEYYIESLDTTHQFNVEPSWPVASGSVTYKLQSRPAAWIRHRNGRWFWHDENDRLAKVLAGSDMPAVEMVMRNVGVRQANNADVELAIQFHFLIACEGRSMAELSYLYGLIHDRLTRGRIQRFGMTVGELAALGVDIGGVTIEGLAFQEREWVSTNEAGSPIATGYFNNCEFDMIVRIRRQMDPLA